MESRGWGGGLIDFLNLGATEWESIFFLNLGTCGGDTTDRPIIIAIWRHIIECNWREGGGRTGDVGRPVRAGGGSRGRRKKGVPITHGPCNAIPYVTSTASEHALLMTSTSLQVSPQHPTRDSKLLLSIVTVCCLPICQ